MKRLFLIAMFAALTLPAAAVDEHHPDEDAAQTTAVTTQTMQANVRKMQAQLDRIAKAKTDEERRKALSEHMQTMQENMMMARGMMGGMMDCPMMGGGPMGMGMGWGTEPGTDRMRHMERRMDMMQMMMEQMQKRMEGPAQR